MRLSLVVLCVAACKGDAAQVPVPSVAPSASADDGEAAQAPSTQPGAPPPTSLADDAGGDAGTASQGPLCLRRDPSHDDLCRNGNEKQYYTWRYDVCKEGLPRTEGERAKAVGRCVAIGPHRAFNLQNWCCP